MASPLITVSVVSHGQNALVNAFLSDLGRLARGDIALLVTENIADGVPLVLPGGIPAERVANPAGKGFGANHNAAFARCATPWFCVVNPDIRFSEDPFPALLAALEDPRAAVAGPRVLSPQGAVEDSARRFPTLGSLVRKAFAGPAGPDYPADAGAQRVDWVAGMFMLFRTDAYAAVGGFDERYFMYYEDVDICRRLGRIGRKVIYQPAATVVHDARRGSRSNLRLAAHHAASVARFLWSSNRS